jgi:hypothetical protein
MTRWGEMSAATEVAAARRRVPAAAEVTAATRMASAAVGLRPNGRRAYQQRTQNAGC